MAQGGNDVEFKIKRGKRGRLRTYLLRKRLERQKKVQAKAAFPLALFWLKVGKSSQEDTTSAYNRTIRFCMQKSIVFAMREESANTARQHFILR